MLNLAEALWAQGRLIAARKLEEAVVAGRRHVLGPNDPDTLKAIGKLAVTIAAQGELGKSARIAGRSCHGDASALRRNRARHVASHQ